jgi:hypothetical protein
VSVYSSINSTEILRNRFRKAEPVALMIARLISSGQSQAPPLRERLIATDRLLLDPSEPARYALRIITHTIDPGLFFVLRHNPAAVSGDFLRRTCGRRWL